MTRIINYFTIKYKATKLLFKNPCVKLDKVGEC